MRSHESDILYDEPGNGVIQPFSCLTQLTFNAFKLSNGVFIKLINVKTPTVL